MRVSALLAIVCLICTVTIAENASETEVRAEAEQKEVLTTLEQRMQTKISIDVIDRPIDVVIRMLAEPAELNVIKSPTVTGGVTAKLTDVPLEEALSNILAAHGYGYVVDKNVIRVAQLEEISRHEERLVSKIYQITYADVAEAADALNRFKSQQGMVSFNKGTSDIIVTDTETKVKAMDTFIEQIDRITPQLLVEVRIYDMTSRDTLDLGVEWQAGRDTAYTALGAEAYGPGRITTIGGNPLRDRDPFITGMFGSTSSETDDVAGALRLGWLNAGIDIDTVLRAQAENINAKLLANPRILVLDNEEAIFDIVREIPYKEVTSTAAAATETIKFKPVGVTLRVTPHVARDGMIRLQIMPEFGVIVGQDDVTNVPTVDTRKINTIALVKDGQTVVLGGLRKKDVAQQTNKIPLLGDLPLLGALFRFETEDTATTELLVFITPRIVEQPITLSTSEQGAYEETEFPGPDPVLTRAEKEYESEE